MVALVTSSMSPLRAGQGCPACHPVSQSNQGLESGSGQLPGVGGLDTPHACNVSFTWADLRGLEVRTVDSSGLPVASGSLTGCHGPDTGWVGILHQRFCGLLLGDGTAGIFLSHWMPLIGLHLVGTADWLPVEGGPAHVGTSQLGVTPGIFHSPVPL